METAAELSFTSRYLQALKSAFKYYAAYSGRCNRFDYWSFTLTNGVITLLLMFLSREHIIFAWGQMVYGFLIFSPSVAIGVRRYHDSELNGTNFFWINFALLVSLYGGMIYLPLLIVAAIFIIINFYFLVRKGTPEANDYGTEDTRPEQTFESAGTIVFILYALLMAGLIYIGLNAKDIYVTNSYQTAAPSATLPLAQ